MFRTFQTACLAALALAAATLAAAADDPAPTHEDVSYGPHPENLLDFYRAESAADGPRPLLVYIHGGGWRGGKNDQNAKTLNPFLEQGISVASITCRFTPEHPLPAPVHDADLPSRDAGHGIHHPVFGIRMKEKCDGLNLECHLELPDQNTPGTFANATDFLLQKLTQAQPE